MKGVSKWKSLLEIVWEKNPDLAEKEIELKDIKKEWLKMSYQLNHVPNKAEGNILCFIYVLLQIGNVKTKLETKETRLSHGRFRVQINAHPRFLGNHHIKFKKIQEMFLDIFPKPVVGHVWEYLGSTGSAVGIHTLIFFVYLFK